MKSTDPSAPTPPQRFHLAAMAWRRSSPSRIQVPIPIKQAQLAMGGLSIFPTSNASTRKGQTNSIQRITFFSTLDGELQATSSSEGMGGFDATLEPGSTAGATESTAQAVPASSIEAQLQGKTTEEKADIKAQAIYESSPYGSYTDSAYDIRIDIIDLDKIDRGIQVFAKAWRGDTQLGFGEDGSVEIERFRVFNPPVMVPDGTYRTVVEQVGPNSIEMEVANYKEDPAEAIRRAIAHTAHVVG